MEAAKKADRAATEYYIRRYKASNEFTTASVLIRATKIAAIRQEIHDKRYVYASSSHYSSQLTL